MEALNYTGFMELVKAQLYKTFGSKAVQFTAAYPKKPLDNVPIITHHMQARPAKVGRDTTELKARQRTSELVDGKVKEVWGKLKDAYITFEVWCQNAEEADRWVEIFETFFDENIGYFKQNGVVEITWIGNNSDQSTDRWEVDLVHRSVEYVCRFETTYTKESEPIAGVTPEIVHPQRRSTKILR